MGKYEELRHYVDHTATNLQNKYRQLDEAIHVVYREFKRYLGPEVEDHISTGERRRDSEGYWRMSVTLALEHRDIHCWFGIKRNESADRYLLKGGIRGEDGYEVTASVPVEDLAGMTESVELLPEWEVFYADLYENLKDWLIVQMKAEVAREMAG